MSEEKQTAPSNENAVNNPNTEVSKNNVEQTVPLSRFSEVNNKAKEMAEELSKYKALEAERIEAEKVAKGEFESVIEQHKNTNQTLQQQLEEANKVVNQWNTYQGEKRDSLMNQLPDTEKEFAEDIKDLAKLERYVQSRVQSNPATAGKMDSQRPGVKPSGEFGGYNSIEEFAMKDPAGAEKYLKQVPGFGWNKLT